MSENGISVLLSLFFKYDSLRVPSVAYFFLGGETAPVRQIIR